MYIVPVSKQHRPSRRSVLRNAAALAAGAVIGATVDEYVFQSSPNVPGVMPGPKRHDKQAGFIIPGYSDPQNWDTPMGTSLAAQIADHNANWAVLQTKFIPETVDAVDFSAQSAVPDSGIRAMAEACTDAGLKVALKPHMQPDAGSATYLPGGFFSYNAEYSTSNNVLTLPSARLDESWVGRRVISLYQSEDIPCGLFGDEVNPFGRAVPDWTYIGSIINSTAALMVDKTGAEVNARASTNRGQLIIPNDAAAASWFAQYKLEIANLIALCQESGRCDLVNIGTELDLVAMCHDDLWRNLVTELRSAFPEVKLTMGSAFTHGTNYIRCWDALDYIGFSFYADVQTANGGTLADARIAMTAYASTLAAMSADWNGKQVLLTELGYRSIVAAGYRPYLTGQIVLPSQQAQNLCVKAFLEVMWPQAWLAGFHWWTWAQPQAEDPDGELESYAVTLADGADKIAGRTFRDALR